MNILLINCPIRLNAAPNNIPYGLATVASTLRADGHTVDIYDLNALRPSQEEILAQCAVRPWDVVGVSGLITTFAFQRWLIPALKAMRPEALAVSGGGLATSSGRLLFASAPVDVAVVGEGEETMRELVRARAEGRSFEGVAGLLYREDGEIVATPPRANICDLDQVPFPAWDLLPMDVYLKNPIWGDAAANSSGFKKGVPVTRSMNVITSRGCPFACNYCYHLFGRSSYRFRSAGNILDEIEALVAGYGADFIGFVDDNTMASQRHLLELCDGFIERDLRLTWGCHGRVDSAAPATLARMAEAGCVWIGFGVESGSPAILKAMNKKTTPGKARQAILDTRAAGIFANTTFIYGYPGETRATIQETVDFKRSLAIECNSFFATPYPGTPLYAAIKDRIPDEVAFIERLGNATDYVLNLTDFDDATFFALKEDMDANRDVM